MTHDKTKQSESKAIVKHQTKSNILIASASVYNT